MPQQRRSDRSFAVPGRAGSGLSRFRHAAAAAALAASLSGAAAPAAAQAREPCIDVNNTTDYWWPVRLRIGTGPWQQMRIDARTFGRLCMRGAAPTAERIGVSVRSSWVPVGACELLPGGLVTILRRPGPDGQEVTDVTCSPPGG